MKQKEKFQTEEPLIKWFKEWSGNKGLVLKLVLQSLKGFPDLTFIFRGKIIFVECKKSGNSKVGKAQLFWKRALRKVGLRVIIGHDVEIIKRQLVRFFDK